jgi:hypothetical protein
MGSVVSSAEVGVEGEAGIAVVGIAVVGIAVVGIAVVGIAVVGIAVVGIAVARTKVAGIAVARTKVAGNREVAAGLGRRQGLVGRARRCRPVPRHSRRLLKGYDG